MRRERNWPLSIGFGLTVCFLYLPIVVLVVLSFNASGLPTSWGGFTTGWYERMLDNDALLDSAFNTLIVAFWATVISVVLGTLLAFGLERAVRSRALDAASYVPMVVPDIVLAIALLSFYNLVFTQWLGMGLGLWSVILGHAVFGIAFVAAIVRTRLRGFDDSTIEASQDLGATEWQTFRHVTLPQIGPGIIAGALVAFTLSLDEFVIAFFTAGTTVTFPIQVYSMVRFGVTPEINAAATVVVVVSLLLMLIALRLRGSEDTTA
ncbi:MAG TPA: ABC transporter permease [Naasia sp.]|jgi:spermidine/putrescine transport system permease protein